MKFYLMLLIATLLQAGDFAISKLYQKKAGTSLKAGFRFNALLGLCTTLIFWGANGFSFHVTPYSLIMATSFASIVMAYTLFGFRILKRTSMALYTLFLMTGGMTVPYIWGLLFLNEEFSWLRTVGLCVLIFAVALTAFDGKRNKIDVKTILMCLVIFVLNGFTSVVSKVHQVELNFETVDTTEFVMLGGVTRFVIAGIAFLVATWYERKQTPSEQTSSTEQVAQPKAKLLFILPLIVCSAVVSGISYYLQLIGASNLPATVVYPVFTGGCMIFSAIVGILAFREKPSKTVLFSILLCFIGTLMFL